MAEGGTLNAGEAARAAWDSLADDERKTVGAILLGALGTRLVFGWRGLLGYVVAWVVVVAGFWGFDPERGDGAG